MRNAFYLVLLGVVLLTIALVVRSGIMARKDPGRPINSAMREAMAEDTPQLSEADETLIREKYATAHRLKSGLIYVVRDPGTGSATPSIGQEVIVNYDARLLNGTKIDSSYKGGAPYTFRLGTGAVIEGWEEAFLTMKKGEKRTLIVPYWLAYGLTGRPPTVPPSSTMVFDVELLDFR
ncbi:MAG: FKBP-type peptidyl-prolyl cis-trans isomerase [Opitutaceae bacterium]